MSNISAFPLLPEIVIGEEDHRKLLGLAMSGFGPAEEAADNLMAELERAKICPTYRIPDGIVRMGSTVTYRTETDEERTVRLVYPAEADISTGAISVLTPVGIALIGLRDGQSISWTARDGRKHALTVLAVRNDDPAPDDEGPSAA